MHETSIVLNTNIGKVVWENYRIRAGNNQNGMSSLVPYLTLLSWHFQKKDL